ncbi:MAG: hypothetical protein JW940_07955 [Polyangiaceae bacterium]|nr:hypothetical protein [Polyangiaceae bacterium]
MLSRHGLIGALVVSSLALVAPGCKKADTGSTTDAGSPGDEFVVLPPDIHCLLHDSTAAFTVGADGQLKGQPSAVKAITCEIKGPQKDVPLVGVQPDGTVLTKDFGRLRISLKNDMAPGSLQSAIHIERIEIQSDKLKAFREFLK